MFNDYVYICQEVRRRATTCSTDRNIGMYSLAVWMARFSLFATREHHLTTGFNDHFLPGRIVPKKMCSFRCLCVVAMRSACPSFSLNSLSAHRLHRYVYRSVHARSRSLARSTEKNSQKIELDLLYNRSR